MSLTVLSDALDDWSFSILVDYLRPLKGNAREETIKQAEAKVNEDGVDFLQAERARVIAQMLSWMDMVVGEDMQAIEIGVTFVG